jgi:hypothetical protein
MLIFRFTISTCSLILGITSIVFPWQALDTPGDVSTNAVEPQYGGADWQMTWRDQNIMVWGVNGLAPTVGDWEIGDEVRRRNIDYGTNLGYALFDVDGTPTWRALGALGLLQAEASANSASSPGSEYDQGEVQDILNELRDLKSKLRAARLLAIDSE